MGWGFCLSKIFSKNITKTIDKLITMVYNNYIKGDVIMTELWDCPVCKENGCISIKANYADEKRSRIIFYSRCSKCGDESEYYDKSGEVIEYLYKRAKRK